MTHFPIYRLINRELDEAVMKERCYKYLNDLYNVIWDEHDVLRNEKPKPTPEEKRNTKEKCLQRLMDFIPCKLTCILFRYGREFV